MKNTSWSISPSPFILTRPTVSRMSIIAIATLVPQILALAIENDVAALCIVAVSLAGCVIAQLFASIPEHKNPFSDGTVILSGLLVGLLLPDTLNPVVAFAASFSGFLVARIVFGGNGSYWVHPVAVSVCIAWISQAALFPAQLVTADGMRMAGDAFSALKLDRFAQMPADQGLASALNSGFLGMFGIQLPEGYITLFCNSPSAIPAFRYNLLTLGASIVLVAASAIDWIIPTVFLLTYGAAIWFFSFLPLTSVFAGGNILFAFLTSGTLFVAFYVLSDFSTSPRTRTGKTVSGFIAGIAAFFICGPGGSAAGGAFTVILMNAINPVIEYIENKIVASAEDIA